MKKYRFLIIVLILLFIGGSGISAVVIYNNPRYAFKSTYDFALPESVELLNFSRTYLDPTMEIKIKFREDDLEKIEKGLLNYYQSKNGSCKINDFTQLPQFGNSFSWQGLNNDEVVFAYTVMTNAKRGAMTQEYYSFIIKESKNEYYLYCADF